MQREQNEGYEKMMREALEEQRKSDKEEPGKRSRIFSATWEGFFWK